MKHYLWVYRYEKILPIACSESDLPALALVDTHPATKCPELMASCLITESDKEWCTNCAPFWKRMRNIIRLKWTKILK